jgi:hypothetical protein
MESVEPVGGNGHLWPISAVKIIANCSHITLYAARFRLFLSPNLTQSWPFAPRLE